MNEGLTASDVLALTRDNGNDWMDNPFIYLIWMLMFGRGWGWGGESPGNALTQAELFDGLGRQDILGNQRELMAGQCGIQSTLGDVRYDNLQNIYALQSAMTGGFYTVNSALAENRFAQQNCCCETQRSIDRLSAEGYRNTCEIKNAIHDEGEATRALIASNVMQDLRDKLADRDRELLYANFTNSQAVQTATLVDTLRPVSRPAYITCSPYTTNNGYCANTYGCGGCTA